MISMKEVFTKPEVAQFRYLVMHAGETLTSQILLPNELAVEGIKKAQDALAAATRVEEGEFVPFSLKGKRLLLWRGNKAGSFAGSLRDSLVSLGCLPGMDFIVVACLQPQVSDHRDLMDEEKGDVFGYGIEGHALARAASHQFDPFNTEAPEAGWSEEEWQEWDKSDKPLEDKASALAEELFVKRPLFFVSFAPEKAPGNEEEIQIALDFMPYIAAAMMQESRTITSPTQFTANVPKNAVKTRPVYD